MGTSDLIFIVGRQRSGTTVFRELLVSHGAMNCDEIFHGNLSHEHRFYRYVLDRVKADAGLVHPEHHARLFRDYIQEKRSIAGGRKLAMDVKYFGLNLIPKREDVTARNPFIIDFMRHSKSHVVHMIRRNKLRVYVSEEMARATGRWSVGSVEHAVKDKPKLRLDLDTMRAALDRLVRQDELVKEMLLTVPQTVQLYYEDMFDGNGNFAGSVQRIASRCMDLGGVSPVPANLKMNPEALEALVDNHSELCKALNGTPHEWMLTDRN